MHPPGRGAERSHVSGDPGLRDRQPVAAAGGVRQKTVKASSRAWRRPRAVWVVLTLLAVATVLLRLPFLTPRLAHWDAVNYALGLHQFNVAAHQPHPPGSPYFIVLGRAALGLTGDDNAAL